MYLVLRSGVSKKVAQEPWKMLHGSFAAAGRTKYHSIGQYRLPDAHTLNLSLLVSSTLRPHSVDSGSHVPTCTPLRFSSLTKDSDIL